MSLQQLSQDQHYYMDSGASSHMQFNQGNIFSLTPCDKSEAIMVSNGALFPVNFIGNTFFPFYQNRLLLNNVLVSNKIGINLIYDRQFTKDNSVSVEFDPFGCDSVGNLYLVLPTSASFDTAFPTVSSHTWHRRLGHPGVSVFRFLASINFISCSSNNLPNCHVCQLGKHCRLSFSDSKNKTSHLFGLLLLLVLVVSSILFSFWMIFHISYGFFLYVLSLMYLKSFVTFVLMCLINLNVTSKCFNVIMVMNIIMLNFKIFFKQMAIKFAYHVRTLPNKMGKLNALFAQ